MFPEYPACTQCPLHVNSQNPGIATRPAFSGYSPAKPQKDQALLIVGGATFQSEDLTKIPFGGNLRPFLEKLYLQAFELAECADLYVTNICRCRTAPGGHPTKGQLKRCRVYLDLDIQHLQEHYGRVVVLALGGQAIKGIMGTSLKVHFSHQGIVYHPGEGCAVAVYASYHPSILFPGQQPNLLSVVRDHLIRLVSDLKEKPSRKVDKPSYEILSPVPSYPVSRLSLDIETYGAIETYPPQTCFHPFKSRYFDKPELLVCSVALSWRDPQGMIRSTFFPLDKPDARNLLIRHLRHGVNCGADILGTNLLFDLMYLRNLEGRLAQLLRPPVLLVDLMVLNYLHSEQRPERSLKALANLFGVACYDESQSLKHYRYPSILNPDFMSYNVLDTVATLKLVEQLEYAIQQDFPQSDKSSDFSKSWYSKLLWTCLYMSESGVAFDPQKLIDLDFQLVLEGALIYSECRHLHNVLVAGSGSEKSKRELFLRSVEKADLVGDSRIETTKVRKQIAINQTNAHVLLQELDPGTKESQILRKQQRFEHTAKLTQSYTRPLLYGTKRNPVSSRLVPTPKGQFRRGVQLAYATWFPVPSVFDSGKEGGTIQGRITSKGPALQTLPAPLKECLTTRYCPGFLSCADLSQIEMRTAALLSGDPLMLEEYHEGIDRHTTTTLRIIAAILKYMEQRDQESITLGDEEFGPSNLVAYLESPEPREMEHFNKIFRQMGKTMNFLVIYHGRAKRLQATIANDMGISLPLSVCEDLIRHDRQRYGTLNAWQEELIAKAKKDHRLEIPLTGQSRIFLGSDRTIDWTYGSEIVNFPIQCTAANIMLDIQNQFVKTLRDNKLYTQVGLNIYDSLFSDGPLGEHQEVRAIADETFQKSEYLHLMEELLDRTIPLEYDWTDLLVESLSP